MSFFLAFLKLAPAVIALVKQVEEAIPGNGKGRAKLDVVLHTVNTAVAASPDVAAAVSGHDLDGAVTALVNGTVSTLNAAGVFKQPTASTTVTTTTTTK
jgi:hypothetical protein